jgi:hypothetical protein
MATPVVIGGLTYYVPALSDENWGQNTADILIALASNLTPGSFFTGIISVTSSPITVLSGRTYLVNTTASRQLNMPTPALGSYFLVKDVTGTASSNNITLHRFSGEKIDGTAADKVLVTNKGVWWLFSDGTDWYTLENAALNANLASIVNADINASAAITRSKIANGNSWRMLINSMTGYMDEAAAITSARALISDANGIPTHSTITSTELTKLSGVTNSLAATFVDRGDPAGYDYAASDFTKDGNWHLLDLSAIVPAGAKAVLVNILFYSTGVVKYFFLDKYGNTNHFAQSALASQVTSQMIGGDMTVACDTNRRIQYNADAAIAVLHFAVKGWWI